MNAAPVPGAVIGVVEKFRKAWIAPLGVQDLDSKRPVTSETLFQAASLSKQVTAYAAFHLRDAGKLDFNKPLVYYVDDLSGDLARSVTLLHVLSHSSGFPNWRWTESGKPVPPLTPSFAPGSQYRYSGEGFFYLQRVMEEVTGKGFAQIAQDLVFTPLGMQSSAFVWDPATLDRTALPHTSKGEPRKNWDRSARTLAAYAGKTSKPLARLRYSEYMAAKGENGEQTLPNNLIPNAAASLVTCAEDYAKFVSAAIRNPEIAEQQTRINEFLGWGLGWAIERWHGHTYVWQWGDNPGFKNFIIAEPSTGNAVFVFTNGDGGQRVYDRAVVKITGHDHPAFFWL